MCTILDIEVLPSILSSFAQHLAYVVKDYCGSISESALRNNFVLLYEILDEVLVFILNRYNFLLLIIYYYQLKGFWLYSKLFNSKIKTINFK